MSINVNDKNIGHATAYAYYKAGGGTMTEAEFTEFMADFGTASQTAVEAAQAALASKNTAQTAATTATTKASEATTAATTATTKAGEASTSASTATSAKDTAVSASQTATTKATEATTAAATAVSAKDDAVSANTAAQSAKTAAQTAQTGAETAAASVQSSAEQIQTNTDDISELNEDLNELNSNFAAMQSDGVVPSAEQILTDKGVTDCVPYHYRKTGGDGADRLYDQIVGGTVNWNQLINDTSTFEVAGGENKTWTSANQFTVDASHKYLALLMQSSALTSATRNRFGININASYTYQSTDSLSAGQKAWAFAPSASGNASLVFWCHTPSANVSFTDFMLHDLTAMFGSTIADYIYNLEQTTAGAGVAFFKSLFPNDYYPYNAGELVSVSGLSEHKMVGFNQFDRVLESGFLDANGADAVNTSAIRSKNYIPVFGGQSYCFTLENNTYVRFRYYDADKAFISLLDVNAQTARGYIFTPPSNAHYMRFYVLKESANSDFCINLSDPAKNGTYEPYEEHSYPLDSDVTLRGIPKLDANNNLYYDGDEYVSDGTVTRKYGIVDLGTLTWEKTTDSRLDVGYYFETNPSISDIASSTINRFCGKYPMMPVRGLGNVINSMGSGVNKIMFGSTNTTTYVIDSTYTDATAFKTAMNGVYLVYELATPTTETAEPYQHLQQCDPNGTEEYVSTGIVPVGHNSFYPENLRAKIEQLPWNFASLIAPTESTFVATRNYTTGSLFIVNNVLYKATSNIANGGTITPNTNCTATTLAEIISALA